MCFLDYKVFVLVTCFIWSFLCTFCFVDSNSTECGGIVTGSYGILSSTNFPAPYLKNQDCNWTIISPEGTSLTVRMLYIALNGSCNNEFIEVTEDRNGFRTCNRTKPKPFQTFGNVVNVRFVSDNKTEPHYYIGFSLEWKVTNKYTLHTEHLTWTAAKDMCALNAGELVNEYEVTEMADLMLNDGITTVWQGKYFTQWVWLEGCYKLDGSEFGSPVILKTNQMIECLEYCDHSNYFGLQADKCFCFNSFVGQRLQTSKNCTNPCPGNHKERCGVNSTLTIYMNDICYNNSSQWTGTVARTYSGKSCIPWTNVTAKDLTFPDDSVLNASNYCRDPDSSLYLWCYVNATHREQCDIPKCIAKDANDSSSCMIYRGPRQFEVDLRFKQYPCNRKAKTSCVSKHYTLGSDRSLMDWTTARTMCRGNKYAITTMFKQSQSMLGSAVFRLNPYVGNIDFHWLGYFRTKTSVSELPPALQPRECLTLTKTSDSIRDSVTGCHERMPFICQHVPITCGEDLSGPDGEISSPGYPTVYGAYIHCQWNLMVATGYTLTLSYEVDIENSTSCRKDSIKIIDHIDGNTLILCGESVGTFNTIGNTATIRFMSDKTVQETKGFRLNWSSGPRTDNYSDGNGGTNTGLILTLTIGLLCVAGIVMLAFAVVRYRKTADIRPRLGSMACKFKTSVPQQAGELDGDNDIDHVSGASFEVSNDSNSQSDDGGSYLNFTFRQGPSSKQNKSISLNNIMYASPHQSVYGISDTDGNTVANSRGEDASIKDDNTIQTDSELQDKAEDIEADLTNPTEEIYGHGRVLYSYARESGFPREAVTVDSEDMNNTYDTYEVNVNQEK